MYIAAAENCHHVSDASHMQSSVHLISKSTSVYWDTILYNIAGQGRAGRCRAGQGDAGQGRAGQGRAGQGRADQGRADQGAVERGRKTHNSKLAKEAYTEAEQAALLIGARWPQVQPHVLHLPHSQLVNGDGHSAYFIIFVQGMVLQQDSCQLLMLRLMHKQLKVLLPPMLNRRVRCKRC